MQYKMLFACNARAILSTCIGNRYLQTASRAFFSTKPKIFLNTTFTKPMQTFFECLAIPLRMGNRVVCMNTDGCGVCLFRHKALSVCLHMRHDLVVFNRTLHMLAHGTGRCSCLHMRQDDADACTCDMILWFSACTCDTILWFSTGLA